MSCVWMRRVYSGLVSVEHRADNHLETRSRGELCLFAFVFAEALVRSSDSPQVDNASGGTESTACLPGVDNSEGTIVRRVARI